MICNKQLSFIVVHIVYHNALKAWQYLRLFCSFWLKVLASVCLYTCQLMGFWIRAFQSKPPRLQIQPAWQRRQNCLSYDQQPVTHSLLHYLLGCSQWIAERCLSLILYHGWISGNEHPLIIFIFYFLLPNLDEWHTPQNPAVCRTDWKTWIINAERQARFSWLNYETDLCWWGWG